jgi:hypothetical protein
VTQLRTAVALSWAVGIVIAGFLTHNDGTGSEPG